MMRDTGLGIGLAIALPILIGLVTDFIAVGVGVGVVAGVVVALQWPPRLRDAGVEEAPVSTASALPGDPS